MSIILLKQPDDIPPPAAPIVDEDYFPQRVGFTPTAMQRQAVLDVEELPAGGLYGVPEDTADWFAGVALAFGHLSASSIAARVAASTLSAIAQVSIRTDEVVPPALGVDEDLWLNIVPYAPTVMVRQAFTDPEELPAATLYGQPDEDFWINLVGFTPTAIFARAFQDPEELPAGSLYGQYDEDFWVNQVRPITWSAQPFTVPDSGEIAIPPTQTVDEDFYEPPPAQPYIMQLRAFLPDADDLPALSLTYEEDFFRPVAPAPMSSFLDIPHVDETVETTASIVDEDAVSIFTPPAIRFAGIALPVDEVVVPTMVDEDYRYDPNPPAPYNMRAVAFQDDDLTLIVPPAPPEEDFNWLLLYGPRPIPQIQRTPLPYLDDEIWVPFVQTVFEWLAMQIGDTVPDLAMSIGAIVPDLALSKLYIPEDRT